MTTLRNLTPHPIRVYPDGDVTRPPFLTLTPDGPPVRLVTTDMTEQFTALGVPVELVEFGQARDLPPQEPGVQLIVSLVVALAVRRDDLLFPYREVREAEGGVVGCRQFGRVM